MRWRPTHLALLLFQALWLNLVLPGHTRGAITLDGGSCATCTDPAPAAKRCCELPGGKHDHPSPKDRANCAVCAFAARVAPPPAVDLTPLHLGLVATLPLPPPSTAASAELIPTYLACGPPVSC